MVGISFADNTLGSSANISADSGASNQGVTNSKVSTIESLPVTDPAKKDCTAWALWCDIKYGITMAESEGLNGVMINGYAYHLGDTLHWPIGTSDGVNEIALGAGYTRTYYNPQFNSEYSLYIMGFMDSFYKPELHVGYIYQKYFDMTDSGHLKWGIGYTPFIFVKPSLTNDAPIPLPGAGLVTSIKYRNFDLMLTYSVQLFLNARIDF